MLFSVLHLASLITILIVINVIFVTHYFIGLTVVSQDIKARGVSVKDKLGSCEELGSRDLQQIKSWGAVLLLIFMLQTRTVVSKAMKHLPVKIYKLYFINSLSA